MKGFITVNEVEWGRLHIEPYSVKAVVPPKDDEHCTEVLIEGMNENGDGSAWIHILEDEEEFEERFDRAMREHGNTLDGTGGR